MPATRCARARRCSASSRRRRATRASCTCAPMLDQRATARCLCAFERKALIRAGKLGERARLRRTRPSAATPESKSLPRRCRTRVFAIARQRRRASGASRATSKSGQVFLHAIGKTVGESEHMQLTALVRNSHPLHFDELYCKDNSFTKQRVVYGGLVFGWVATLASRDVARQRAVGSRARRRRAPQRRRRRRHALRRVEGARRRATAARSRSASSA